MKKINFSELKNYYNEVVELHGFVEKVRDLGPKKEAPAPTTKKCPYCCTDIDIKATRCPHCTSEV
jgi:large conductance mechanosensitive channel